EALARTSTRLLRHFDPPLDERERSAFGRFAIHALLSWMQEGMNKTGFDLFAYLDYTLEAINAAWPGYLERGWLRMLIRREAGLPPQQRKPEKGAAATGVICDLHADERNKS